MTSAKVKTAIKRLGEGFRPKKKLMQCSEEEDV